MVVEQLWQPVPGGSGTYIVELSRALRARQVPVAGITARHQAAPSPREMGLPPMPMRSSHLPRAALYESWNRLGLPRAESILPGAQLIHATTWALPPTSLPLAVTVHDLAFLRTPEHFTPRGNAYFSRSLERVIAEASAIIVPSQATADDCIAAGIDAARLYVIPHGVRTRPVTEEQIKSFRTARGLTRDYVLWTGTREPRKNLLGLLRAFALLIEEHDDADGLDLVLVGPAGWGDDAVEPFSADDAQEDFADGAVGGEVGCVGAGRYVGAAADSSDLAGGQAALDLARIALILGNSRGGTRLRAHVPTVPDDAAIRQVAAGACG